MFFNDLALYRKAIYKKIDEIYACDWFIEDVDKGVKEFDASELSSVTRLPIKKMGPFYKVKGLKELLKEDYDVYFMLGATRNLSLITFCLRKRLFYRQKKVYLWSHGYYGKESWIEKVFWKRPMFKMADGIFTYGDFAKRLMVEDGFDDTKVYPIHNSLDYDNQLVLRKEMKASDIYKEHFNNSCATIVFIGRLTEIKRLDMLIAAVSILKRQGEQYNLVFIGDGVMREKLEAQVNESGIEQQVWFFGACYDDRQNAELVYNADLCVAPGNIGLTSIHALMFGCPAISHDNFYYQMPEFEAIKPGKTGNFYKYGSIEDLASTISRWFKSNNDRRNEVRQACYDEIDSFWNPYYQLDVITKNLK